MTSAAKSRSLSRADATLFTVPTISSTTGVTSNLRSEGVSTTPGVGGVLCAKHHCFTRAARSSAEGRSPPLITGDSGEEENTGGVCTEEAVVEVVPETCTCVFLGVGDDEDDGGEEARGDTTRGGDDRGEVNNGEPFRGTEAVGAARFFELTGFAASKLPDLLLGGVGVWVAGCVTGAA
jgi:hypothetical protein